MTAGTVGNSIEIEFVNPGSNNAPLSVSVSGNKITVNLATNDSGTITSTASHIVSAINGDGDASALVTASGTGSDAVSTGSVTLTGGADASTGGYLASLKVDNVDADTTTTGGVLTQDGANAAITNINKAIEQVSAERSKLGAIQNRLEHTIANLGTQQRTFAAESRSVTSTWLKRSCPSPKPDSPAGCNCDVGSG